MYSNACITACGVSDGGDDVRIGAAAADIATHELADFLLRARPSLREKRYRRHDLARCAKAALKAIVANERVLDGVQAAFLSHDAYQCGYCTSGQIMSAVALLKEPCGPDDAAVKEFMSGNICRCGAYPNIVAAIQQVRRGQERTSCIPSNT